MKRIAVLTSGGDASTMNKCLSTLVTYANQNDCEIYFVFNGYKGLYNNEIYKANYTETRLWWDQPGTRIFSSRFTDILKEEVQQKMVENLKQHQIDYLVVIGGDGSYKGARLLSKSGVKVFCLPGTIDNDVASSSYSIGFDTSLNVVVNAIKQIKSCMNSHANVAMVEIMGRHCIDLTVFAGIATEADIVITPESHYSPSELLTRILEKRKTNKRGIVILFVENYLGTNDIPSAKEYIDFIHKNSNEAVKLTVLGYTQRGGQPTAMDLLRASMMSLEVFSLIKDNQFNKIIGNHEFEVVAYDIEDGIEMRNPSRKELIEKFFK